MRKLLCFLVAFVCLSWQAGAQSFGLEVETVIEHDYDAGDPLIALDGMTTYRLWATTENATDFVSAVVGEALNPVSVLTTTSFYQDTFGTTVGATINPALIAAFPAVAYDSWVTIGREDSNSPGSSVSLIGDLWTSPFESGNSININDAVGGGWYILNGDINGVAGPDNRVLVGQFTTDGEFSGQLYIQFFPLGVGANEVRFALPFSAGGVEVEGCTDAAACNYDPAATLDDGTCAVNDECGNCGGAETTGCTDDTACNYDAAASCDDSSCEFASCAGCTDDTACNYDAAATIDDGSCAVNDACGNCGGTETAGCTDDTACNYDGGASCDDGSCIIPSANAIETFDQALVACVGDGQPDEILFETSIGDGATNYAWVITDSDANILGVQLIDFNGSIFASTSINFEDAPAGNCLIWVINFEELDGAVEGNNAATDLAGCYDLSEPVEIVRNAAGCTDPAAGNYNPAACADDGSCEDVAVPGCTDNTACNYDQLANLDDDSCEFESCAGCTEGDACNFDATATIDDGSCDFSCYGCTETAACNFDADATINDGSCDFTSCSGCTDNDACNYDATSTIDDGSCDFSCYGCTDATACNYDAPATIDDDSCIIVVAASLSSSSDLETCSGDGNDDIIDVVAAGGSGPAAIWVITTDAFDVLAIDDVQGSEASFNLEGAGAGTCLIWRVYFDPNDITLADNAQDIEGCFALSNSIAVVRSEGGCTDDLAINFNADACYDDGSCNFSDDCVVSCPEDVTVECGSDTSAETLGSPQGFNCLDYAIVMDEDQISGDDCFYTITRTWNVYLPGLEDIYTSCSQTINVIDSEGPVFTDVPADVTVQCLEDVPAQGDAFAEDDCNDVVSVTPFDSETGNPVNTCTGATAIADANAGASWAIWLPVLAADGTADSEAFVGSDLMFVEYADGTAHLTGTVVSDMNSDQGFVIDLWLDNKQNWAQWSGNVPTRNYKDDLGYGIENNNYQAWNYYEMVDGFSTLTGFGDYEGSILYMNHMPASYYYGFQCGLGANNKNGNFGMSGWFTYTGIVNDMPVSGQGDVNIDKECVPNEEQDCPHNDEFTYFWRAVDDCGNATIATQVITVFDDIAPEFTVAPENITVQCDEVPVALGDVEATDNCVGDVTINYLGEVESAIGCVYTITRTWAAFDLCGNRADHVQIITVEDTTPPVVTFVPANTSFECDEVVTEELAEGTDNCQEPVIVTFSDEITAGDCPQEYTITRTFTLSDGCENESTATQTIEVVDTTAPVFGPYEVEVSVECNDVDSVVGPDATDNCSLEVEITFEDTDQSGGCMGVIYRVYTATDECGNSTTTEQYITLIDTTPPTIENPADETVQCDDVPEAPGADGIEIYDNCGLEVTVTFNEEIVPGLCEDSYSIVWTWTAVDFCNNMSEATTTITVIDTTNPTLENVPADDSVECSDELPAVVMPTGLDNCDDDVEVVMTTNEIPGECDGEYTLERIFRGFDNCGNSVMYVQTITVVDTTPPTMDAPEDASYECNTEIPVVLPVADDNCSEATVTYEDGPSVEGQCAQEYSFERTYTATDDCDNSSSVSHMITVVDTTDPVFDAYEVEIEMPCDDIMEVNLTATDNCDEDVTVSFIDTPVSGGCAGRIIRDFIATDNCGNTATAQQVITLTDAVAPVWTLFPSDVDAECDDVPGIDGIEVDYTDNCTDVSLAYDGMVETPGDCENSYTIEHTWTITDNCGNSTPRTWTINVSDNTPPVFTEVAENETVQCSDELPAPFAAATDNCDTAVQVDVVGVNTPGECPQEYTMVRTYTATDNCGNTATATQTLTIVDTTAPVLDYAGGTMTLECDETVELPVVGASDNCDTDVIPVMDMSSTPGECANSWTETYTWYATDDCDNTSNEVTLVVTYEDNTAPVLDAYDVELDMPCDDITASVITATDNCGLATCTFVDTPVSGGCAGRIIRDWICVDACGNTETAQQVITLIDVVPPTVAAEPMDLIIECDEEVPGFTPEWDDNCDDDLELTSLSSTGLLDCGSFISRSWTATDACGNSTTVTQSITILDTTPPVLSIESAEETVECNVSIDLPQVTATDNCDEDVEIIMGTEVIEGDCANEWTEVYTWTAYDECDNTDVAVLTVNYVDTTPPTFDSVPSSNEFSCEETLPTTMATASDNCDDDVTVTSDDVIIDGNCPQAYTLVRTFTATDNCGNSATATTEYFVYDNTPPVFTSMPEDIDVECASDVPAMVAPEATDNCGIASVVCTTEILSEDECGNYEAVVTCVASDECGNESSLSYSISVNDVTPPTFDQVLPENITIDCSAELPVAEECTASDNCDSEVLNLSYSEEIVGELPAEGSSADCLATTPVAYNDNGTVCTGDDPWAMKLFDFLGQEFVLYSAIEANWVEYPDGSATLSATLVRNDDPERGYNVSATFENGIDYATWDSQGFPTGFKDDCTLSGDNHFDWTYYIMSAGATLTGWGENEGSTLMLSHAPSSLYYGYQVGVAANNVNEEYGSGGWFTFVGTVNGEQVDGSGDFAFDHDCCPRYSVERTWTAEDCSGNVTSFTQVIDFADLGIDPEVVDPVDAGAVVEAKGDFMFTKIAPNPAVDHTTIEFYANTNNTVRMEVYDLSGRVVATLFNGNIVKGQTYTTTYNTSSVESGMYTVRLSSTNTAKNQKLSVAK